MCPLIIGALAPSVNQVDARLAQHRENINSTMTDINQLLEDLVGIITQMTRYEARVCHCGENRDCLSDMSYSEPPVASSSGRSFPSELSSSLFPFLLQQLQSQLWTSPFLHWDQVVQIRRIAA